MCYNDDKMHPVTWYNAKNTLKSKHFHKSDSDAREYNLIFMMIVYEIKACAIILPNRCIDVTVIYIILYKFTRLSPVT